MDDRLRVDFLGRDQWKAVSEIESELATEHASGTGSRSIGLVDFVVADFLEQFQIRLHT